MSDEVDRELAILLRPSGDAGAGVMRREALDTLLEHADEAHPRLLALVASGAPPPLALMALAEFGRPESVPVLERLLHEADDPTTAVAAAALGEHPADEALRALEAALGEERTQVVLSSIMGLRERGDPRAAGALRALGDHGDPEVRERAAAAAEALADD
jgi:HEAT repeat protein